MNSLRLVVTVCVLSLAFASAAYAGGGAAGQAYGPAGGEVQEGVSQGASPAAAAGGNSGGLPFTGLDLAFLVVGGATLLVAGTALRRAARRRA
jgi:hypothetical protein